MGYKSTRRQWVKLWVNEWLDGTTRFELTYQQRLLWIDLLALAGRSRFPGLIYAGDGKGGKRIGYPAEYLAGILQMDKVTLNNALKILKDHEHITLEESAPEEYIIGVLNWEKYQSEYLRQRTYRKVTTNATNRLLVEGEVEVDVEGEGDKKKPPAIARLPLAKPEKRKKEKSKARGSVRTLDDFPAERSTIAMNVTGPPPPYASRGRSNANELYTLLRTKFKGVVGKSMGSLGREGGELWVAACEEYNSEIIEKAFDLWVEAEDYLGATKPANRFIYHISDWIAEANEPIRPKTEKAHVSAFDKIPLAPKQTYDHSWEKKYAKEKLSGER